MDIDIVTKEDFESLLDVENLTVKKDQDIRRRIDERLLRVLNKTCTSGVSWGFSYEWHSEDQDDYNDSLKVVASMTHIKVYGRFRLNKNLEKGLDFKWGEGLNIPVRWLWEDYENEIDKMIEEDKSRRAKAILKAEEDKKYAKDQEQAIIDSIKAKLTPEEFKHIRICYKN